MKMRNKLFLFLTLFYTMHGMQAQVKNGMGCIKNLVQLYQKHASGRSSVGSKSAREVIQNLSLRGNEHILDFGGGVGTVAAELAKLVSEDGFVLSVDSDPETIAEAQKNHGHLSNLAFKQGDMMRFKAGKVKADYAFSLSTFHLISEEDKPKALASIYNALGPGGKLVLTMRECGGQTILSQFMACHEVGKVRYYPSAPGQIKKLLVANRFKGITIERKVFEDSFENEEVAFAYAYCCLRYMTDLSEDKANMIAADFAKEACLKQDSVHYLHVLAQRLD